ncbi:MAG TPA: hypothetical protein VLB44_22345 [Kofleriaceae bacterium]|nr:hypothetical protein [Kofleriaceae bacterium]
MQLLRQNEQMLLELCRESGVDVERYVVNADDPAELRAQKLATMRDETERMVAEMKSELEAELANPDELPTVGASDLPDSDPEE